MNSSVSFALKRRAVPRL